MMFKNRALALFLSTTLALFVAVPAASALTVNLNIFRAENTNVIPAASLVGPAGGLGQTWNQRSTSTSVTPLLDALGNATTIGYTTTNLGGPDTWGNPALGILRDGLRNFNTAPGNTQQLVINGLTPGDLFDVYLVSANMLSGTGANAQRSNGQWSTTNAAATVGAQSANNTLSLNGTTFVQGNNYVFFDNVVVNPAGQMIFNGFSINQAPTFDNRLPLNGFQLVSVIPEPATATLGLLSVAGLMLRRRREA